MGTALHRDMTPNEGIHVIQNWNFADAAARTSYSYLASDIGKVARQLDNNTFWIVTGTAPTFLQISGSSGGPSGTVQVSADDSTPAFLENKVVAGSNVTVTVLNDGGNEQIQIASTGGSSPDEQVKVSANDTTTSFLENKIVAGSNVTVTVLNDGGNEQIEIAAASSVDEQVKVSANDTTTSFLENKIVAGSNISVNVLNDGGNEQIQISATGASGDVVGPGFSEQNAIAVFTDSSGNEIRSTNAFIDGYDNLMLEGSKITIKTTTSLPQTPDDGYLTIFPYRKSGRTILNQIGSSGRDFAFQPLIAENKIGFWSATGNGTGVSTINFNNTTTGTSVNRNVGTSSLLASMRRIGRTTTTTAGTSAGFRHGSNQFWIGNAPGLGGFHYITRFGFSDVTTNMRGFVGLSSTTGVLGNADPSTVANTIAFAFDSADSTWHFIHNDAAGTATKINLEADYPCKVANVAWAAQIFCRSNDTQVFYHFSILNTSFEISGSVNTDLPLATQLLNPQIWVNNGSDNALVGVDVVSQYIETDY